jgi:DNA-binding NarL/FixJ family response regulator
MAQHDNGTTSVLIVDDAVAVRRDLRIALGLAGNIKVVGEAADGTEAVRLAESLAPAVVLLDLEMPVMDGYEAARRIKALRPGCRIVALTAHGYELARRKALQSGVDDFVIKGASLESLIAAIA